MNDKILAIGAHFDTVNITAGVDDNGAGCAAVLEVARQITEMDMKRQNTIIFISWDVEEMCKYHLTIALTCLYNKYTASLRLLI